MSDFENYKYEESKQPIKELLQISQKAYAHYCK